MGLYVKKFLCEELNAREDDVLRADPLPDFGGIDPNPFLVNPVEFSDVIQEDGCNMGFAFDADGVSFMFCLHIDKVIFANKTACNVMLKRIKKTVFLQFQVNM